MEKVIDKSAEEDFLNFIESDSIRDENIDKDSDELFELDSDSFTTALDKRELSEEEQQDITFDPDENRKKKRKIIPYTPEQIKRQIKLLKYSDLFLYFLRPQDHPELQIELDKLPQFLRSTPEKAKGHQRQRDANRSDKLSEVDHDEQEGTVMHFSQHPEFIHSTNEKKMRDYQIDGLNWLIQMYADGMNGILADEMGLGKTLQVISLLGYLLKIETIRGPHLIICPKSVAPNWASEFEMWMPKQFRVMVLVGEKEYRKPLVERMKSDPSCFDVIVTTPEVYMIEASFLKKLKYEYVIIDEAHRIKNQEAKFTQNIKSVKSKHSLLITGTPLQNNLDELWSLLNFLSNDVFSDHEDFTYWINNQPKESEAVEKLKMVISPFILRRLKIDVEKGLLPKKVRQIYTGLSSIQSKLYIDLLTKDPTLINNVRNAKNSHRSLQNLLMQLRKCVNHPYIFPSIEPTPHQEGEHLVESCGKLSVLDQLLKFWKKNGDRILIFSQMTTVLDILEDYCVMRDFKYCRIDGSTAHEDRVTQIQQFNEPGSDKFLFLLSTRSAGQGINLTSANIVVIYDIDWNPQVDLQAQDRAHRIGQTKQVYVYQFITDNSIEIKVMEKATKRLKLDQLVIQKGAKNNIPKQNDPLDTLSTIRHGAKEMFENNGVSTIKTETIQEILAKSEERSKKFEQQIESLTFNQLLTIQDSSSLDDERNRHQVIPKNDKLEFLAPNAGGRERKIVNYSELSKPKKPPTDYSQYDFRFYPPQLSEFYQREYDYYLKCYPDLIPAHFTPGTPERKRILAATPLTESEEITKHQLISKGFNNWNKKEYQLLIRILKDPSLVCIEDLFEKFKDSKGNPMKTPKEINDYLGSMLNNYRRLSDWEYVWSLFCAWTKRLNKVKIQVKLLNRINEQAENSSFKYPLESNSKSNQYSQFSPSQELALLLIAHECKLENHRSYADIQSKIQNHPDFAGCWGICSLSEEEIQHKLTDVIDKILQLPEYKDIINLNNNNPNMQKVSNHCNSKAIANGTNNIKARKVSKPAGGAGTSTKLLHQQSQTTVQSKSKQVGSNQNITPASAPQPQQPSQLPQGLPQSSNLPTQPHANQSFPPHSISTQSQMQQPPQSSQVSSQLNPVPQNNLYSNPSYGFPIRSAVPSPSNPIPMSTSQNPIYQVPVSNLPNLSVPLYATSQASHYAQTINTTARNLQIANYIYQHNNQLTQQQREVLASQIRAAYNQINTTLASQTTHPVEPYTMAAVSNHQALISPTFAQVQNQQPYTVIAPVPIQGTSQFPPHLHNVSGPADPLGNGMAYPVRPQYMTMQHAQVNQPTANPQQNHPSHSNLNTNINQRPPQ